MLKFSGFADLTSCLERRPLGLVVETLPQAKRRKTASKMLFKLLAAAIPHALHAPRVPCSLSEQARADTQKHADDKEPTQGGDKSLV